MNLPQYEIIDIATLSAGEIDLAIQRMTDCKRERVLRMAREDDRIRSAASEHLARRMAVHYLGITEENVMIKQTESGQPFLAGLPCYISLSHSGRWAMCALSDYPVGADIESISDRGKRIIKKICTPAEQEYILASGTFDSVRFTMVWTAKEAWAKHIGIGLAAGLSGLVVADSSGLFAEADGRRFISGIHEDAVYTVVY